MEIGKASEVIRKIAETNGIEVSIMRAEMQRAILAGYEKSGKRPKWERIFGKGKIPSPEEFILKILSMITIYTNDCKYLPFVE